MVLDLRWSEEGGGNGGFIQEVLGFNRVALQQAMDVVQVARAAGLWVPERSFSFRASCADSAGQAWDCGCHESLDSLLIELPWGWRM
ncbi:hypothetical protein ABTZ70_32885, partial [Streptomyces sp. NPDC094149]